MRKYLLAVFIVALGIGIFRVPLLKAVTASYNQTVRIVDSAGNVIGGTASAITANYNQTVRVVDSTNHVLDNFGAGSTGPTGPTGPAGATGPTGPAGSSGISGLTTNTIPKATSATAIGNSSVSDNGTTVSTTEAVSVGSLASTTPIPATSGGVGTTQGQPACTNQGTITNGGTETPDFTNTNCSAFTLASGASFTMANPTNLPSSGIVSLQMTTAGTGRPTITWGTHYFAMDPASAVQIAISSMTTGFSLMWTGKANGVSTLFFQTDGTNLYLISPLDLLAIEVRAFTGHFVGGAGFGVALDSGSQLIFSGDAVLTKAPRSAYTFSIAQQTALVANEHMGSYKTVQPITIENATVDEENVTCASAATVTCYDCGNAAGACTSGQTATIWTSPSITSANTGLSVAGGSITTANVAAGEYITCEVTAGTCATFQVSASLQYRMQ